MKRLQLVFFLLGCLGAARVAGAQSTSVAGTIVDQASQAYANGTYTINFHPNGFQPSQYRWTGGALTQQFTGSLNGSGAFTVSIPDNSFITPTGSQWDFQVCPAANSVCTTVTISVIGGSQDVSSTINASLPATQVRLDPAPNAKPFARAYSDAEIVGPIAGAVYYNLTDSCPHTYNGTTWSSMCGGGGGGDVNPASVGCNAVYNTSTSISGGYTTFGTCIVVDATQFPGADMCAKLNAAILAVGQGTVDARGFIGPQLCNSNPFFGTGGEYTILLSNQVIITTTVSWQTATLPIQAVCIIGDYPGQLSGSGPALIQTDPTFPSSTAVIELKTFGGCIRNLAISLSTDNSDIGILLSQNSQAFIDNVSVADSGLSTTNIGIKETATSGVSRVDIQNVSFFGRFLYSIWLAPGSSYFNYLRNIRFPSNTITGPLQISGGSGTIIDGLQWQSSGGPAVHIDGTGTSNLVVSNVVANNSPTTLVQIDSGTHSNLSFFNLSTNGTNIIIDSASGHTLTTTACGELGQYTLTSTTGKIVSTCPISLTVASLPSVASSIGQKYVVTDSTSVAAEGQTCVGGSANSAIAISNGSVWKCF